MWDVLDMGAGTSLFLTQPHAPCLLLNCAPRSPSPPGIVPDTLRHSVTCPYHVCCCVQLLPAQGHLGCKWRRSTRPRGVHATCISCGAGTAKRVGPADQLIKLASSCTLAAGICCCLVQDTRAQPLEVCCTMLSAVTAFNCCVPSAPAFLTAYVLAFPSHYTLRLQCAGLWLTPMRTWWLMLITSKQL